MLTIEQIKLKLFSYQRNLLKSRFSVKSIKLSININKLINVQAIS